MDRFTTGWTSVQREIMKSLQNLERSPAFFAARPWPIGLILVDGHSTLLQNDDP
jgi:hypothetical protein